MKNSQMNDDRTGKQGELFLEMRLRKPRWQILVLLLLSQCPIFMYLHGYQSFNKWRLWDWPIKKNMLKYSSRTDILQQIVSIDTQKRRQKLVHKYCELNPTTGTAQSVIIESKSGVSYCLSRKIASTFWLQVLTFLDLRRQSSVDNRNDNYLNENSHLFLKGGNSDINKLSPLEFRKLDVQLRPTLKYRSVENDMEKQLIFNTTRFMFVRDPFTRLWSVFLDKFVNLDWWFYNRFGTVILKNKGLNVRTAADLCDKRHSITFQDFLEFVVFWNNKTNGKMDDHFGTVVNHCNPCVFKPDFIGKLETFETDRRHVLKLLDFEDYSEYLDSVDQPLQEMLLLTEYNYYMFHRRFKKCVPWCVKRLLDMFKMNGYLSKKSTERLKIKPPLSKSNFISELKHEYEIANRSKETISAAKMKWKILAFKRIDLHTLNLIAKIYELETRMFGYDSFPDFIKQNDN